MEPARLGTSKRRPRRGSVERPVDLRIVRNLGALLVVPLLLLLLTMVRTGPLPAPALPPAFDGRTAAALTAELVGDNANRVPGSPGAASAAQWFRDKLALYGLPVREDVWRQDVAGLGDVELRNLATVVRGTLAETIVFVAHRDNNGLSAGANSDASGTAALVELARAYATAGTTESARTPLHTLVFLSADARSVRLARRRPLRRPFAARARCGGRRLARRDRGRGAAPAGDRRARRRIRRRRRSSAPRTRGSRRRPAALRARPGFLDQLVSLGLPFGYGAQAPLLGKEIPAVRLTTASDGGTPPGGDEIATLDRARLTQLGRASETLLNSLDAAVELPTTTAGALYLGSRAVRGWALGLLLLVAVVPFAGAALDLLSRCRRRRLALRAGVARVAAAFRALARRARAARPGGARGCAPRGARAPAGAGPAARRPVARRRRRPGRHRRGARVGPCPLAPDPPGARATRGGPRGVRRRVRRAPRHRSLDGVGLARTASCSCCPRSTRGSLCRSCVAGLHG